MTVQQIAEICHEVNRLYCKSIGDNSQLAWEEAPQWQRDSVMNGVNFHIGKDRKPEDSHNNWLKEKLDAGWKYGEVKNADKKEHPCCVSYDKLPLEQQIKDSLFIAVVKNLEQLI